MLNHLLELFHAVVIGLRSDGCVLTLRTFDGNFLASILHMSLQFLPRHLNVTVLALDWSYQTLILDMLNVKFIQVASFAVDALDL